MKCFLFYRYGIFEYLLHSSLTRKYKNENITLYFTLQENENFRNHFFFFTLQLLPEADVPRCSVLKLFVD